MAPTKRLGKGAIVSIKTRFLHPSRLIQSKHINHTNDHRTENLRVVRKEIKLNKRKRQMSSVVTSEEYKDENGEGKTVSLLLRLTKSVWHTGTKVTMDPGFAVAMGLVELHKKGVFGQRRYWPRYIDGDRIKDFSGDGGIAIPLEVESGASGLPPEFQCTCPGFMVYSRKPWKFGNQYHTVAEVEDKVIFISHMVDG